MIVFVLLRTHYLESSAANVSEVRGKVFTPWTLKIVEILGSSESVSLIKLISSNCILTDFF